MTKAILWLPAQIWGAIAGAVCFLVVVLPPTLLVSPLPLRLRLSIISPFWGFFSHFVIKFIAWSSLYSEDHRQPELRTYPPTGLYISNHQSYMDIPLMLTQYQTLPIMKKEVAYIPVFGLMAVAAGALPVSRGKRDSRKKVFVAARKRLVDDKFSLQYYPEGTRSRMGRPKPYEEIKITLMQLAFENNVPLIPISMYGSNRVLNKNGTLNPGQNLGIITHAALLPKDYADVNQFCRAAWDRVTTGYDQLEAKLGRPQS